MFYYGITVPSGTGSSAVLEFSVPEFQRFREAGEMVTQEEQLEMFANQVSLKLSNSCHSTIVILKLLNVVSLRR